MVPWDRTPAGIGSPGVRVLYGMKNGKAGMMLTIRDYRAEDLADAAAHLECHCGTGGQLPGRCGFAAGGSGPLLPFPDQDGGGAGRRRTGGSLCPPSEQHRPVFAHRQRLLWGEGGAQRPGHWTALVLDSLESARRSAFAASNSMLSSRRTRRRSPCTNNWDSCGSAPSPEDIAGRTGGMWIPMYISTISADKGIRCPVSKRRRFVPLRQRPADGIRIQPEI